MKTFLAIWLAVFGLLAIALDRHDGRAAIFMAPISTGGGGGITHTQSVLGTLGASGATVSITLGTLSTGQSVLCGIFYLNSIATLNTVSDGTNSYTIGDFVVGSSIDLYIFTKISVTGVTTPTITATFSQSVTTPQIVCDVYSGATSISGHAINAQSAPGTGTDAIVSTAATSVNGGLSWGVTGDSTSIGTMSAGTGYTLRNDDSSSSDWKATTEDKAATITSTQATFTNSVGTGGYATAVVNIQ